MLKPTHERRRKRPNNDWKSQLPCFHLSPLQEILPCWKLSFSGKMFTMINRNNYMCNNWRSINRRYNKLRSILHFRIAERNINFRWGILNFVIVGIIQNFRWNSRQHNTRFNVRCQSREDTNESVHNWNRAKSCSGKLDSFYVVVV